MCGTDARTLRPAQFVRRTTFGCGHDSTDRPAADSARAKSERAKEAVVQLCPLAGLDELPNRLRNDWRARALKHSPDVAGTGFEERAGRHRILDLCHFVHCATFPAPALVCKLQRRASRPQ